MVCLSCATGFLTPRAPGHTLTQVDKPRSQTSVALRKSLPRLTWNPQKAFISWQPWAFFRGECQFTLSPACGIKRTSWSTQMGVVLKGTDFLLLSLQNHQKRGVRSKKTDPTPLDNIPAAPSVLRSPPRPRVPGPWLAPPRPPRFGRPRFLSFPRIGSVLWFCGLVVCCLDITLKLPDLACGFSKSATYDLLDGRQLVSLGSVPGCAWMECVHQRKTNFDRSKE